VPDIEGLGAVVYDIDKDMVVYGKNERVPLPLASITKLMTVITAYDYLSSDSVIVIKKSDTDVEGESNIRVGEKWTLEDLSAYSLVVSSNDGVSAIARSAEEMAFQNSGEYRSFVELMNKKAHDLGFVQTVFLNPTGLDMTPAIAGAYGSAYEVAILMKIFIKEFPALSEATSQKEISKSPIGGSPKKAKNTNVSTDDIPFLFSSKTGFTDQAGGNLVLSFAPGVSNPFIVTVLGSTKEKRFVDVKTLVNRTINHINTKEEEIDETEQST